MAARELSLEHELTDDPVYVAGLDAEVFGITGFSREDEQDRLVRGVPLTHVMRCGGRLLASQVGTLATFKLSQAVGELDGFISHNWCTSRLGKFLALALLYNFDAAVVITIACSVLLGLLQMVGVIWADVRVHSDPLHAVGFSCRVMSLPTFAAVLLFWRDLAAVFRRRVPLVFLDKACVHQTDEVMKTRGIRKLAAFIGRSQTMVVLYSDFYLQKLWTTFEIASFLVQHPLEKLQIAPISHAVTYCSALGLFYILALVTMCLQIISDLAELSCVVLFVLGVGGVLLLRQWHRHRYLIEKRLEHFSIRACTCAVESDRQVVNNNVAVLMRGHGFAAPNASVEEALDAFDVLARGSLRHTFFSAISTRWIFTRRHYFFIGFVAHGTAMLDSLTRLSSGAPARACLAWLGKDLFWTVTGWPLAVLSVEAVAAYRLELEGRLELAMAIVACTAFLVVGFLALDAGVGTIAGLAKDSNLALTALFGASVVGSFGLASATRPYPQQLKRLSVIAQEVSLEHYSWGEGTAASVDVCDGAAPLDTQSDGSRGEDSGKDVHKSGDLLPDSGLRLASQGEGDGPDVYESTFCEDLARSVV